MNRLPFSENPNGSYYYHGSTLYFVNTAGQAIQLETFSTKADARQMCQHRNNYLDGVGCGATELSEDKIPKQHIQFKDSYCYQGKTLYFVDATGRATQLESYEYEETAIGVCAERNNYQLKMWCGANRLPECQLPKTIE